MISKRLSASQFWTKFIWLVIFGVEWAEGEGPATTTVYSIEVADSHTFFVSAQGVWVKTE